MRFTEHELTLAVAGAAKTVAAPTWTDLGRYERYQILERVGSQVLPVLIALPDVPVAPGIRPSFTDTQVKSAVQDTLGDVGGRLRRRVVVAARVVLVRAALDQLPVRQDPDGLTAAD